MACAEYEFLVRWVIERIYNQKQIHTVDEHYSPDCQRSSPDGPFEGRTAALTLDPWLKSVSRADCEVIATSLARGPDRSRDCKGAVVCGYGCGALAADQ